MKVSILINNYNYGRYLAECIESALNQTYRNREVILYDDGSNDNSLDIAKDYSDRIQILSRPNYKSYPSFNQANAINEAMAVSTGDIICLLDSDDVFFPNKVEKVVNEFEKNPNLVMVQHLFEEIDSASKPTGVLRPEIREGDPSHLIYEDCTLINLFAQTSALSFRRIYLEKVLPIKEDEFEKIWPDVRLTRQTIFYGDVTTLQKPLTKYRLHEKNDSHKNKDISYYRDVITQMYGFFNRVAYSHNMKRLSLFDSIEYEAISRRNRFKHLSFFKKIKKKIMTSF